MTAVIVCIVNNKYCIYVYHIYVYNMCCVCICTHKLLYTMSVYTHYLNVCYC